MTGAEIFNKIIDLNKQIGQLKEALDCANVFGYARTILGEQLQMSKQALQHYMESEYKRVGH